MRYFITHDGQLIVYDECNRVIHMYKDYERWYRVDYNIYGIGSNQYYYYNSKGMEKVISYE